MFVFLGLVVKGGTVGDASSFAEFCPCERGGEVLAKQKTTRMAVWIPKPLDKINLSEYIYAMGSGSVEFKALFPKKCQKFFHTREKAGLR